MYFIIEYCVARKEIHLLYLSGLECISAIDKLPWVWLEQWTWAYLAQFRLRANTGQYLHTSFFHLLNQTEKCHI
jgi:hypothetical protein